MKQIKQKNKTEMRSAYPEFFDRWRGQDLPAQHRFMDIGDGSVIFSAHANPVLQSTDEGKSWHLYEGPVNLPSFHWLFRRGDHWVMIGGRCKIRRSFDGGKSWGRETGFDTPDSVHYRGLETPNIFSAIMTERSGNIVMVSDNFLGQEGPDGQLISSIVSEDFGLTWKVSRLFGPAQPLPPGPEGFGEPAVVEMPSHWLWMVMRTVYGELWQCISRDGGLTWNDPTPTGLASPIANCYAKREPRTGATVLAFNLTKPGVCVDFRARHGLYRPRRNLVFMVSRDNCRTWTCPVVVDEGEAQYPSIHFTDKTMFIGYQASPDEKTPWGDMGLVVVTYDLKEVMSLPPWNAKTIQPYIDAGLVAHWLALHCARPLGKTIE